MEAILSEKIKSILGGLGLPISDISLEHPADIANGDYSTNIAMVLAKNLNRNPKDLAEDLVLQMKQDMSIHVQDIKVAGPGFINFFLKRDFFSDSVIKISENVSVGKGDFLSGKKVIVEYTDPNPFKEFHIGHLMSNTIGESISRIYEYNGADIKRACYQGDVGLHVAKAILGMQEEKDTPKEGDTIDVWAKYLGKCYALGANLYESSDEYKEKVKEINKKVYEKNDDEINHLYETGRKKSLEYFEEIYKKLGTKFDFYFFESETAQFGKKVVEENMSNDIFEKGDDGAIVFKGEKYNPKLHTRVFINSQGLPTYEAKELGLSKIKFDTFNYDESIIITGNEINDYFRVLLEAMNQVFPDLAKKTIHLSHGMLRLPTGKMSSRTGDVITGETLLEDIGEKIKEKIKDSNKELENLDTLINNIAVSALKYSVLKQATGKDIVFDFEKSVSFEGDSGPYLAYSHARACSVLEKAKNNISNNIEIPEDCFEIEKYLYRFPEIIKTAYIEKAPHIISVYLVEISRLFNSFYANNQIVDTEDKYSSYKIVLTKSFVNVLKNGLYVLGIVAPEKM